MFKPFRYDSPHIQLTTYKKLIYELRRTGLFPKKDSLNKKIKNNLKSL
jgi:hypothetical protein